jgi:hypothetical protein
MLKINVSTVPQDEQRYATIGDYWDSEDGTLEVRVTDLGDRRYEFLIALHELIEQELCRTRGIAEPDIMSFDVAYEEARKRGDPNVLEEPGDDPRAPYHREHVFASNIERMIAAELGVNWERYEESLEEHWERQQQSEQKIA